MRALTDRLLLEFSIDKNGKAHESIRSKHLPPKEK